VLRVALKLPETLRRGCAGQADERCERRIAAAHDIADRGRKGDAWLLQTARWTWQVKLAWQLEGELFAACASAPRPRRSACSPPTCTTCCWRRPPATA
jgi:uncharacterized protein